MSDYSTEFNEPLQINHKPLSISDSHRHLGVILTSDLTWKAHLSQLKSMCSKKTGLLKWLCRDLPASVITKLYIQYVRPSLEYAAPVWHGSINESEATDLERVQCSLARYLLKAKPDTPTKNLLKDMGWPSLRWRREIASMCLFAELVHTRPPLLRDCLPAFAKDKVDRAHRKPYQLILIKCNTSRFLNSFLVRSSVIWNTLPSEIQSVQSRRKFRNLIEEHWASHKFDTHTNLFSTLS